MVKLAAKKGINEIKNNKKLNIETIAIRFQVKMLINLFGRLIFVCSSYLNITNFDFLNDRLKRMKKIAIFASGSGTNAECIARYFSEKTGVDVCLVLSNKKNAGVLDRAEKMGIKTKVFSREIFYKTNKIIDLLQESEIDLIVLAGFLWLVPENILQKFPNRILNIHPALLPEYGGKGMFGHHVHKAVISNGERKSGITIHFVNEKYDDGQIIFQKELDVLPDDTPDSLASRIHKIEHQYFPKVIEEVLMKI